MSVSTMVDTFDTPMIDFSEDADIPMGGSADSSAWFQPLSHMDEDSHLHNHPDPLEVDMMVYDYDETEEYEMGNESYVTAPEVETETFTQTYAPSDDNVLDAEVYDLSVHSSPLPPPALELDEHYIADTVPTDVLHVPTEMPQSDDAATTQNFTNPHVVHVSEIPLDASAVHQHEYLDSREGVGHGHENDEPEHLGGSTSNAVRTSREVSVAADAGPSSSQMEQASHQGGSEGYHHDESEGNDERLKSHTAASPSLLEPVVAHEEHEAGFGEYPEDGDEHPDDQDSLLEETTATGDDTSAQPEHHHTPEQVYLDPPPPISLSLQVTSDEGDQPEFALFSTPEPASASVDGTPAEEPLLLLQHHASLFYEPISAVFEAFRQEEYFSHLEELSDAEMALNAFDLQLVISEDNVYAREVSLHDLYAMHQGVGLPGHLRLMLQSVVPRFIARYNLLRDQITRLAIAEETEVAQQQDENTVDGHQDHETQTFSAPAASQNLENEDHEGPTSEETEESKNADEDQSPDDGNERIHQDQEQEHSDNLTESLDVCEVEKDQPESAVHQVDEEYDTKDSHVEFGEEVEAGEILDADGLHVPDEKDSEDAEEPAAEYVDVEEPDEEGEEGYNDDFDADGADGAGTGGEADESVVPTVEDGTNSQVVEDGERQPAAKPDDAQAQEMAHSLSASSYGTEESTWDADADVEEVDTLADLKEQTDHSSQKIPEVFDEGNLVEGGDEGGDEFGDDDFEDDEFGDDDFGDSTEDTLDDSAEVSAVDADAASKAVLVDSQKFVIDLGDVGSDNADAGAVDADVDARQRRDRASESPVNKKDVESTSDESVVVHKNSKRSLHDAELDEQESASPSSPLDSKRLRVL